jgi:hypothetical protein
MFKDQISSGYPNAVILTASDRHTSQMVENSAENNVPCAQVCISVTAAAVFFTIPSNDGRF